MFHNNNHSVLNINVNFSININMLDIKFHTLSYTNH